MDNYNKIWSLIIKTDLLNYDEKDELHLYLGNLKEQLKKKDEVIDKAVEYIKETSIGSILEVHCGCEEDYIEPLLQILEDKEVQE